MSETVVLVTGAGSGIGRAVTLAFAAANTTSEGRSPTVIAADLDFAAAKETAATAGPTVIVTEMDVTSTPSVDHAFGRTWPANTASWASPRRRPSTTPVTTSG
jgi:2-hydroxycyclohexanecarboxyl-CoA dehydrogenase